MDKNSVIIFDGVCNFCNATVDFVIKRDRKKRFLFTANQNEAGKEILARQGQQVENVNTLFLYENGRLYRRSTAALRIARKLRFPWFLMYGFIIVPPFIRDAVYKWIARNRYKWWGKSDSCRVPSPEERARFLD